jgi:hypothetical protein
MTTTRMIVRTPQKSVRIPETKLRERRPAQHNHASWHRFSPAEPSAAQPGNWLLACLRGRG